MALPLNEAFTARAIATVWDRYKQELGTPPFLGRTKFGTRKQRGLDLRFITGESGLPVTLKASNFDAQAHLRDGIGFKDIQNEMPFFRESYMVTEREQQDYENYMAAENAALANQVLSEIMKSPRDLIRGAEVVPERMIWQLLAPTDGVPKITVNLGGDTNKAYTIHYTSDNGVAFKSKHYFQMTGTAAWSAPATATPLNDLITARRTFAKNTGQQLSRFSMNTETFEMLLAAEDTKKQVLGITAYQGGIRMRQEDALEYLRSYGITIEVYDKMYVNEAGTSTYFIPTGVISAQAEGAILGDFVFGTTPEERSGDMSIGNIAVVESGIAVYTYMTPHPINTHCVVSMIGLPSFEGMNGVAVLKVA